MIGDIHDITQYSQGQKDIAFTKSLYLILVKNLKNSSLLIQIFVKIALGMMFADILDIEQAFSGL